jgi:membrane-bound ClpP family serine protease
MNIMRTITVPFVALALASVAWAQAPALKPAGKPASKPAASAATNPKQGAGDDAAKQRQVFILKQSGMVGVGLRAAEMEKVEKAADKFGPGQIIVLHINSGGGLVTEADEIDKVLNRVREKHRLVAWIEEAISAAAVTAMHCREMYFMNLGSLGSATMFSGDKSIEGAQLEAWLRRIAEISEAGGRNGHLAKCMVYSPLVVSYTRDPKTGKVTFFEDGSGEKMLSDEKDNLTLTADQALDCGFSQGTANTQEELFEKMQLKPGTFVVNQEGRKIGETWEKTLANAEKQRRVIMQDWNLAGDGVKGLAKRIELCKKMQDVWKRAEPVAMGYEGGGPLFPPDVEGVASDLFEKFGSGDASKSKLAVEAIDRVIKEYQRKIAEAKKSGDGN